MKIFTRKRSRLHPRLGGPKAGRGRGYAMPFLAILILAGVILAALFLRESASGLLWRAAAPLYAVGGRVGHGAQSLLSPFITKHTLQFQNIELRAELAAATAAAADRELLKRENERLKAALGRGDLERTKTLAFVLARPPQLPYDTLMLDIGSDNGVTEHTIVGSGAAAIGVIDQVSASHARVALFSSPGMQTSGLLRGEIPVLLIGRGGGGFTVHVVRGSGISPGDQVSLAGAPGAVAAIVASVQSTTGEAFDTLNLTLPANVFLLPHVEVWSVRLPQTFSSTTAYR